MLLALRLEAGCPRKSFTEQVPQVPARARITVRLRQAAGAAVADGNRTIVQAARDLGVSWPVVAAAFTTHAATVLPAEPEPVTSWASTRSARQTVLELTKPRVVDHHRRPLARRLRGSGRRARAARPGRGPNQQGGDRLAHPTTRRLAQQIKAVAIDMCTVFKAAVREALPHALLVVDHFHVVHSPTRPSRRSAAA